MNLVVFGANGPTGQLLTKQALEEGYALTAVTRHPETFPLQHPMLRVIRGDVNDLSAVGAAVAGQDAVLSTLGVPYSRKEITVYSKGIANIIEAMKHHGVRRLVCVSSSAVVPHADHGGGFLFEKILQPFFTRVVGRTLYADMKRMETLVMASGLDWTIIRPSGLFATPAVTPYQTAEGFIRGTFTSRTDLADCMLQQLKSDRYLQKVAAVVTVSEQPNLFKLLWKEGISKKAQPVERQPVAGR